jgi:hypothetical protein
MSLAPRLFRDYLFQLIFIVLGNNFDGIGKRRPYSLATLTTWTALVTTPIGWNIK